MGNFPLATADTSSDVNFTGNPGDVGVKYFTIDKAIDGSTDAASHAIQADLPANSVVDFIYIRNTAAATFTTATALGFGISTDLNKYAEITGTTIDAVGEEQKIAVVISATNQPTTADSTLSLYSTNGSGTAAGSVTGSWVIQIVGRTFEPLSKI